MQIRWIEYWFEIKWYTSSDESIINWIDFRVRTWLKNLLICMSFFTVEKMLINSGFIIKQTAFNSVHRFIYTISAALWIDMKNATTRQSHHKMWDAFEMSANVLVWIQSYASYVLSKYKDDKSSFHKIGIAPIVWDSYTRTQCNSSC